MGVPGLHTYVTEKGLLREHRLKSCSLVIDGGHLLYVLYGNFRERQGDECFGGDYASFALFIESFLDALTECAIKSVVIMDGAAKEEKRATTLFRFGERLKKAKEISEGKGKGGRIILPLLSSTIFVQILQKRNIPVFTAVNEADDILPTIAKDLKAFLLSGDSDFLLQDIPAGVIDPKCLFADGKFSLKMEASGGFYMNCQLYRLSHLLALFPGLSVSLTPFAGPILGNDYIDEKKAKKVTVKLAKLKVVKTANKSQFDNVFSWLATNSSPALAKENLKRICGAENSVICYIEKNCIEQSIPLCKVTPSQSIEEYFKDNTEVLFAQPKPRCMPKWVAEGEAEQLKSRLICIFHRQLELFYPLVEDCVLKDSSYEAVFELCEYIYGLLRTDEAFPSVVTRHVRLGKRRIEQGVLPRTKIGIERLPMLEDVASLSKSDRLALFKRILGFEPQPLLGFQMQLKCWLSTTVGISIPEQLWSQLETLLHSTIYLLRNFSIRMWIEFLYALLVNILFMGYYSKADVSIPKLLQFSDSAEADKLRKSLNASFNQMPTFNPAKGRCEARITHQYNAWQNCLNSIALLASTLNLADDFHANTLVCGLEGSFIYSLAVELAKQPEPLTYLKKTVLSPRAFPLFESVLRFVLENSKRGFKGSRSQKKMKIDNIAVGIIPSYTIKVRPGEPNRYLSRSSYRASARKG